MILLVIQNLPHPHIWPDMPAWGRGTDKILLGNIGVLGYLLVLLAQILLVTISILQMASRSVSCIPVVLHSSAYSGTVKCMVCPYPTATEFFPIGCGIDDGSYSKNYVLSLLTIDACIVISVVVLPKLRAACTARPTAESTPLCVHQNP